MKKKMFCTTLLLSFYCILTLIGCGTKEEPSAEKDPIESNDTTGETLGEFSIEDVGGNMYTQEMFEDYDITMINIFATWCTPCVNEIPDLEKLKNEMEDQGVYVVGIVLDAVDQYGNVQDKVIEQAKLLAERTEASYPFLIPDESNLNGRLTGINAVPETFFVDKEGNILGEAYIGSHSLEEWKTIIETVQKEVSK